MAAPTASANSYAITLTTDANFPSGSAYHSQASRWASINPFLVAVDSGEFRVRDPGGTWGAWRSAALSVAGNVVSSLDIADLSGQVASTVITSAETTLSTQGHKIQLRKTSSATAGGTVSISWTINTTGQAGVWTVLTANAVVSLTYDRDWSSIGGYDDDESSGAFGVDLGANMAVRTWTDLVPHVFLDSLGYNPAVYPKLRTISTEQTFNGESRSLKLYLDRGVADGNGRYRVELRYGIGTLVKPVNQFYSVQFNDDVWIGYAVRLNSQHWPTTAQTSNYLTFAQFPVSFAGFGATCSLQLSPALNGKCIFQTNAPQQQYYNSNPAVSGRNFELDKWYYLTLHVRMSSIGNTDGACEVWVTDTTSGATIKVLNYSGAVNDPNLDTGADGGGYTASQNQYALTLGLYGGTTRVPANTSLPGLTYECYYSRIRGYIAPDGGNYFDVVHYQ